jgi:hypothetical protein
MLESLAVVEQRESGSEAKRESEREREIKNKKKPLIFNKSNG